MGPCGIGNALYIPIFIIVNEMKIMKNIFILICIIISSHCFSQINTFYVKPIDKDKNYEAVQDSHLIVKNNALNLNKLFLFIGGTNSRTKDYFRICEFAGDLSYDVINVSYPNNVAASSLNNSPDEFAFDNYRREICYGNDVSTDVSIEFINSIQVRTLKLIKYLDDEYPSDNWGQYLNGNGLPDWPKIAVGGHSQGAGHACYFGKKEFPERVLMFSGPNDYSNFFSEPVGWLKIPGITPPNKHYAYLSLLDEVIDFNKQLSNMDGLGLYPLYDTLLVDSSMIPFENTRCLYTQQAPGLAILHHN